VASVAPRIGELTCESQSQDQEATTWLGFVCIDSPLPGRRDLLLTGFAPRWENAQFTITTCGALEDSVGMSPTLGKVIIAMGAILEVQNDIINN